MRRRLAVLGVVAVAVAALAVVVLARGGAPGAPRILTPGAGNTETTVDPIAWDPDRKAELERRAAAGLAHVLYAKSPGGVVVSAVRTATWRPLIDRVAKRAHLDPDMLEAIVVRKSARLTRGIERGHKVAQRLRERRRVDERFDPAKALTATARYLQIAKARLHRTDLAIAAYHMGIGNMQTALRAYGKRKIPYARLYFDSTPLRHARAYRILAALGDDSSTYLWRVMAARNVMRLYRHDPEELARQADLQGRKASAEEVLHPPDRTPAYGDPFAIQRALGSGQLQRLDRRTLAGFGIRIDHGMGELAGRLHQRRSLYRALRPQALRMLEVIGAGTRAIARTRPLVVTSTVRDERYQRVLEAQNIQATHNFSLHTTGWT